MSEPFYDPDGRIHNKDVAENLADLEKPGRDIALEKEEELAEKHKLQEEAQTGETAVGKMKAEFVEYLFKEYPDVFEKITDEKGRDALIHFEPNINKPFGPILITRYGMVPFALLNVGFLNFDKQPDLIKEKLEEITDVLKEGGGNTQYSFGSNAIVLDRIEPLVGGKGSTGRLYLNFTDECPKIATMDVRNEKEIKLEAKKEFGK